MTVDLRIHLTRWALWPRHMSDLDGGGSWHSATFLCFSLDWWRDLP